MSIPSALARALPALAASLALSACGGTVDFSVDQYLDVDSTVGAGVKTAPADLATSAGSAWSERKHIDSITITSAEVTVTALLPGNTAGGHVGGSVWLLPDGATDTSAAGSVKVGDLVDEPVAVGNVVVLQPTAQLSAFVRNAFNGNGRFVVYAVGTPTNTGDRVACTLHVVVGGKLKWSPF
jgi:hypothetical protein